MLEHLARQADHVVAGGQVIGSAVRRRQTVDAVKLSVRHAQCPGLAVHQGHEAVGAAGNVFGDGIGRIIGGFDHGRGHQFIQCKSFAGLEEHLGSAHALGVLGSRNGIAEL